jgi:hypothetical protein
VNNCPATAKLRRRRSAETPEASFGRRPRPQQLVRLRSFRLWGQLYFRHHLQLLVCQTPDLSRAHGACRAFSDFTSLLNVILM